MQSLIYFDAFDCVRYKVTGTNPIRADKCHTYLLFEIFIIYMISKYMIASAQITNTGIFAFIPVLFYKLLNREVSFINRKDNKNY